MTRAMVVAKKTVSFATGIAVTHIQRAVDNITTERMTRMTSIRLLQSRLMGMATPVAAKHFRTYEFV